MVDVASQISEVLVYRRGAVVTRTADLVDGDSLRIPGLPLCLDDHSVSVRLDQAGDRFAAQVHVGLDVGTLDDLPPSVDQAIRDAQDQVLHLNDRIAALDQSLNRLALLQVKERPRGERGHPPGASPVEARLALLRFREEEANNVRQSQAQLKEQLREADVRLQTLLAKRDAASTAKEPRPEQLKKAIRLSMVGEGSGGQVVLSYRVPGACWAPSYDLALNEDLTRGTLRNRAVVAQRTGEDWSDVPIRLCTADAEGWHDLPKLASLRIGRVQRPPATTWRPPATGAEALYADFDRVFVSPEPAFGGAMAISAAPPIPEPLARGLVEDEEWEEEDMMMAGAEPEVMAMPEAELDMMAPPPAPLAQGVRRSKRARAPSPSKTRAQKPKPKPREVVDRTLWDFGRLVLPAFDAPHRGQLQSMDVTTWLAQEVTISVSVTELLIMAQNEALRLEPLPPTLQQPHPIEGFHGVFEGSIADVPSDGAFHSVDLETHELTLAPHFVSVPRETADVFRQVRFDAPFTLLPGPVEVRLGDRWLVTSEVSGAAPSTSVTVGLGVEERIRIARNTSFSEEAGGLVRGHVDLQHTIDFSVRNLMERAVEIEIRERVPCTYEEDDDVKVTGPGETWESWIPPNEALGQVRTQVSVPGKESQDLQLRYTIRIPGGHEIHGGNRRA